MVRLKEVLRERTFAIQANFNSTMVRLKAANILCMKTRKANFNSTMVRLKDYGLYTRCQSTIISIPLWYD